MARTRDVSVTSSIPATGLCLLRLFPIEMLPNTIKKNYGGRTALVLVLMRRCGRHMTLNLRYTMYDLRVQTGWERVARGRVVMGWWRRMVGNRSLALASACLAKDRTPVIDRRYRSAWRRIQCPKAKAATGYGKEGAKKLDFPHNPAFWKEKKFMQGGKNLRLEEYCGNLRGCEPGRAC